MPGSTGTFKKALKTAVPIMVQNGITNFVNMLDSVMVGRIGTDPMSAAAIVNQLIFVFSLCIFGGMSGIGIFTAQYRGKKDVKGVRDTFRLMILLSLLLAGAGMTVLILFGKPLIGLYLTEDGGIGNAAETMRYALEYASVLLLMPVPFALTQAYAAVMRASGDTVTPMRAGILAMLVNLAGNYILIFGRLGMPALGIRGAAAATVLARVVEFAWLASKAHSDPDRYPYVSGVWKSFRVPAPLVKACIRKGSPLLINEALWSSGTAVMVQLYSTLGLSVVAAFNILTTITNVFNVTFIAMGSAVGILIGQDLGAGKTDTVIDDAVHLTWSTNALCAGIGAVLFLIAPLFPYAYSTSQEIRMLAVRLIRISAVFMPVYGCCNSAYFILRSGGKTWITFLFDSAFTWMAGIPLLYILLHTCTLPVPVLYACVQSADLIKVAAGLVLIRKGIWIHDITRTAASG